MKRNYIITAFIFCILSAACSDMQYVSNDPDADPDAPAYSDVDDRKQTYSLYFRPSDGWVGDPMPYYANGRFHVFYLQDARDGAPTFHPWYKATTSDLVNYEDNGEAIPCGEDGSQEDALGTGSVFQHGNLYYAFYTAHNSDLNPAEKIYMATSTDLNTWTKHPEFELVAEDGYDRNEFRDPQIFKDEASNTYKMLISTRADYKGSWRGVIAQYSSTDMWNWTLEEPFYDDLEAFMLECPDVFIMGDKQYLIYSDIDDNDRMVHYRYRSVNGGEWIIPEQDVLDGRAYYAAKTASDGTNRYLFGWCPTRDGYNDTSDYSWGGSLVVHQLIQNSDGILKVTVPNMVHNNFKESLALKTLLMKGAQEQGTTFRLSGSGSEKALTLFERQQGGYKITAKITASSATRFGFEFGAGATRLRVHDLVFDLENKELKLNYIANGEVYTRTEMPLSVPSNQEFDVTLIIENSVCVAYVNNEIALTCRIYQMNRNPWGIFAENGDVTFSDVKVYK